MGIVSKKTGHRQKQKQAYSTKASARYEGKNHPPQIKASLHANIQVADKDVLESPTPRKAHRWKAELAVIRGKPRKVAYG